MPQKTNAKKTPKTNASTNGGSKANSNGKVLESAIESIANIRGFRTVHHSMYNPAHWVGKRVLIANASFETIYDAYANGVTRSKTEYVLKDEHEVRTRVECKWQQTGGTTDEKFPFVFLNAIKCPEERVIILVDGGGARKKAVEWLKNAKNDPVFNIPTTKTIEVMNIAEFMRSMNAAA